MPKAVVSFFELRGDWYRGADLMARLIDQSRHGAPKLIAFPAQWLPLFEHFGVSWADPIEPPEYIPLVSEMSTAAFLELISGARRHGCLRVLVEGFAALDPLVADVLHKLDRRADWPITMESTVQFTGWQSYGRPEILDLEKRVFCHAKARAPVAVLLPCARRRPYPESKTHKRIGKALGDSEEPLDRIVISSLGVIPSDFWDDPVVIAYDSGVPDIYRTLRLMRAFFGQASYSAVIDCLEFEPYRDCLSIIHREGLVGEIRPGPGRKIRKLPRP